MILRIKKYNNQTFVDGLQYGYKNNQWIDRLNAFLLALSPILQHYKGIYRNAGFTVLFFVVVISFFRLFMHGMERRIDSNCIRAIVPMFLFQIYKIFDHSVTVSKTLYGLFMLLFFFEIASGAINTKYFVRCATTIGSLAAVCLILQYITFYIFGKHTIMIPVSALLPECDAWLLGVKTGLYGLRGVRSGFYRPSAFFLEPSHLFLYCFPMLCVNLFLPNMNSWRKRKAILLSAAMLLSTSGMGVTITVFLWIVYIMLYNSSSAASNRAKVWNLFKGRNVLLLIVFIVTIIVAYFRIPVFQNSADRILGAINGGNTSAIDGRTKLARDLIRGTSGKYLLFGITDNVDDINFNLSGFFATVYKYGIIGILLSYLFYVQGLFRLQSAFFWLSSIIVVISFFTAHTHGTFYMLYFVVLLINGYHRSESLSH